MCLQMSLLALLFQQSCYPISFGKCFVFLFVHFGLVIGNTFAKNQFRSLGRQSVGKSQGKYRFFLYFTGFFKLLSHFSDSEGRWFDSSQAHQKTAILRWLFLFVYNLIFCFSLLFFCLIAFGLLACGQLQSLPL